MGKWVVLRRSASPVFLEIFCCTIFLGAQNGTFVAWKRPHPAIDLSTIKIHKAVQVCISLVINQFSEAPACLGPRISHGALVKQVVGLMVTCRKWVAAARIWVRSVHFYQQNPKKSSILVFEFSIVNWPAILGIPHLSWKPPDFVHHEILGFFLAIPADPRGSVWKWRHSLQHQGSRIRRMDNSKDDQCFL